jgi:hypothetical protein
VLQPRAPVASGPEPEGAELVGDIACGEVETSARCVTPQHRVVRDDADMPGDILGRDGSRGPSNRRAGLPLRLTLLYPGSQEQGRRVNAA